MIEGLFTIGKRIFHMPCKSDASDPMDDNGSRGKEVVGDGDDPSDRRNDSGCSCLMNKQHKKGEAGARAEKDCGVLQNRERDERQDEEVPPLLRQ